jgi:Fe2+ or Zn2+ uptake regulation protein
MGKLIEKARTRLYAQGGRMTPQRELILDTLECCGDHPTAEEVFSAVKHRDPNLNLSTVYRTLRWLEAEELVSTRLFNEGRRQERFDAVLPSEHHHFMCTICKEVTEFDNDLFETIKYQFEDRTGACVERGSIVLYGLCAKCRRKQFLTKSMAKAE